MKVIDMHCDTLSVLLEKRKKGAGGNLRCNSGQVDLQRLRKSHYLIQNFAMFVVLEGAGDPRNPQDPMVSQDSKAPQDPKAPWGPWEKVCELYRYYQEELDRNRDILAPVLKFSDIAENEAAGKLSSLLTVEEGGVCGGEIEKLRRLYQMGVRMMTLTWNFDNEIGHPNYDTGQKALMKQSMGDWKNCPPGTPEWEEKRRVAQAVLDSYLHTPNLTGGLTEKGREMVEEMEALGMIPDVSHLSDAGFYDVLEVTGKPFVASHSNARAVCPCVRNMTDDMIRKLAERGGVMGLNFCADFLEEKPLGENNPGTIEAVVRHAGYIANVGGIEVLGLGSDFDGIDMHAELPGAQSMERLWDALHRAGFSQDALDRIFYGNVLRVYRDTLK